MMAGPHYHEELVLHRYPAGDCSKIYVKPGTAQHFGWLAQYETYDDLIRREVAEGLRERGRLPRRTSRRATGRECRIGRGKVMRKNEAGLTHAFRLSRLVTNRQLAELAHFTQGDWHWMQDVGGKRRTREQWEELYARTP